MINSNLLSFISVFTKERTIYQFFVVSTLTIAAFLTVELEFDNIEKALEPIIICLCCLKKTALEE